MRLKKGELLELDGGTMLNDFEIRNYLEIEHAIWKEGQEYINTWRGTEASRMVGEHATQNVCSWVYSKKIGMTISTESRGAERVFKNISENDENTLEIWEQGPAIKIKYRHKNGKLGASTYRPDFLLLTKNGPLIVEVKPYKKLLKEVVKSPNKWVRNSLGEFEYIPGKEAFEKIGLRLVTFAVKTEHQIISNNLEIMERAASHGKCCNKLKEKIVKLFDDSFTWSMHDLFEKVGLREYTPIVQLISERVLFFSIDSELLGNPKCCYLSLSESLVAEAKLLREDAKTYDELDYKSIEFNKFPSQLYAQKSLERLEKIKNGETGRSIRRWKKLISDGAKEGLTPFQSLISKKYLSGNRKSRINPKVLDHLYDHIFTVHAKTHGLSLYSSYFSYVESAERCHPGVDSVCRKTFQQRIREIPEEILERGRNGKKAANAASAPTDPKYRSFKAQIPWQCAAIDHCLADIYLILFSDSETVIVERPWITAMIDISTGCILAFSISFSSPSRIACAKVIRDCVRKHGRLPAEVIVDRGPDFKSVYFFSLFAHYKVTVSLRPTGHSRYGGEVEGFFGDFKTQWLNIREGYIDNSKNARSVDGIKAPMKSAILRPYDLYREMHAYCKWRESTPKNIHIQSSAESFTDGQMKYPFMAIPVEENDEFMLATAVDSKNYSVDFRRGIHINELFYYTPKIELVRGKKSKLEVRTDPENPYLIYALIDNKWEACYGSDVRCFSSMNAAERFEKGLVGIEGAKHRRKYGEERRKILIKIQREMEQLANNGARSIVHLPEVESEAAGDSLFDEIDISQARKLSVGEW